VDIWILIAPLIVVCITVLTTYGNQRFREPADLSLVLLAAVGVNQLWRQRRRGRRRTAAPRAARAPG
jgi:hypothetical protein